MINGFRIYDADAHVNVAPQMWEDLPKEFAARRPRMFQKARNTRFCSITRCVCLARLEPCWNDGSPVLTAPRLCIKYQKARREREKRDAANLQDKIKATVRSGKDKMYFDWFLLGAGLSKTHEA